MTPESLLAEARELALEERVALVEAIWNSVAEDADGAALPVPDWHREELDRRAASGNVTVSPWSEVRERLERRRS